MSIFSNIFLAFDIFKTPFSLRFNQRKSVSTYLGSFLSICVISILIYYAVESDLFYRLTPQVIDSSMGLEHRPFVNFTRVKAIGVQDDLTLLGVVDPSIFNLVAISYHYDLKNTSNIKEEYKKIHLCSELDFPENPNLFTELNLANNFCFEENNFDLEGYWDEKIMNYGTIHLMLCNNETYNNKLKGYDEMIKYLNGNTFNLYYILLE